MVVAVSAERERLRELTAALKKNLEACVHDPAAHVGGHFLRVGHVGVADHRDNLAAQTALIELECLFAPAVEGWPGEPVVAVLAFGSAALVMKGLL